MWHRREFPRTPQATPPVITVMPGSSVLDLNIDVVIKVFAFYVAYIVWAALTVLLANVFFTLYGARGQAKA
jgi:hypothetical protein